VTVQRFVGSVSIIAMCVLAWAVPARSQSEAQPRAQAQTQAQPQAQTPLRAAQTTAALARAKYQVSVMEGVLERAVENAARVLNVQLQPAMPEMFVWGSAARARGFWLEGYGVFFDVEVPMIRPSMVWSLQVIGPPADALKSLREHVQTIANPQEREQLDRALRQIEIQFPARGPNAATADAKTAHVPAVDPNEAYTTGVTTAIVDSMLDYGTPLQIGADEWLTVAARDYEGQRGLAPDAPYDLVTVVMRIKGSDLQAFRAGRLTRDEARKRVEQREF
jgi:hypothetical protein